MKKDDEMIYVYFSDFPKQFLNDVLLLGSI